MLDRLESPVLMVFTDKWRLPIHVRARRAVGDSSIFFFAWLLQNARQAVPQKNFVRVLFNKGFDKRFFNPDNYGQKDKLAELKMSGKELYRAIKGAVLTGNMPNFCTGLTSGLSQPCQVDVAEKEISLNGVRLPGYNLSFIVDSGAQVNISFYAGDVATLSASDDGNGGIIYGYPVVDWKPKFQIGDRVHSGFLLFRKENAASQSGLVLDAVIIKPGIVVSIDKKRDPVCLVSAPKVQSLIDDGILIQQRNAQSNLVTQMYSATPPFAGCSAGNVAE